MNRVVIALAAGVLTGGSALASDRDDILAVLKQWSSGAAGTVAVCADDAAVIDDIPPFEWHGPGACSRWQKDNDAYLRQGISEEIFTVDNPQQLMISGARIHGGSDHIQGKRFNKTRVSCRPSARHEWRRR